VVALYVWWVKAVERARGEGSRDAGPERPLFFEYRFWFRYGGWAVFSGWNCFLLPAISTAGSAWWQSLPSQTAQPLITTLLGDLILFFGLVVWMIALPFFSLAVQLTAPDIGLLPTGLRLVPLPLWPARDVPWSEITRVVARLPRRGVRRDSLSHYVYLRDGSYVPFYDRSMRDPKPLVEALASRFAIETEIWPRW
jgi:hypothetical protein